MIKTPWMAQRTEQLRKKEKREKLWAIFEESSEVKSGLKLSHVSKAEKGRR